MRPRPRAPQPSCENWVYSVKLLLWTDSRILTQGTAHERRQNVYKNCPPYGLSGCTQAAAVGAGRQLWRSANPLQQHSSCLNQHPSLTPNRAASQKRALMPRIPYLRRSHEHWLRGLGECHHRGVSGEPPAPSPPEAAAAGPTAGSQQQISMLMLQQGG